MKDLIENEYQSYTYSDLITSFECEVLHKESENDYSGDSLFLLKDLTKGYGFLEFGWGSCSGCDALEGCDTLQEVIELRDELYNSIHWEENLEDLHSYLLLRDWEGSWIDEELYKPVLTKLVEMLKT